MLTLTALLIVASWPTEPAWNYAMVNPVIDPDGTHPIAVACYDEALDSKVVVLPDGTRRHVAFVREATTRDYLFRRGWVDRTDEFRACRELAAKETTATTSAAEVEATLLAAIRSSDAPRGVTTLFLSRASKLAIDEIEPRLAALVASGKIERVGEGGPVVLYREPKKAA